MSGDSYDSWTVDVTTVGSTTKNYILAGHTSSTDSVGMGIDLDFPDWADEGNIVIDKDDIELVVVGQYIDENELCLQVEDVESGEEREVLLSLVEPEW